jgi:hypothetical protein
MVLDGERQADVLDTCTPFTDVGWLTWRTAKQLEKLVLAGLTAGDRDGGGHFARCGHRRPPRREPPPNDSRHPATNVRLSRLKRPEKAHEPY